MSRALGRVVDVGCSIVVVVMRLGLPVQRRVSNVARPLQRHARGRRRGPEQGSNDDDDDIQSAHAEHSSSEGAGSPRRGAIALFLRAAWPVADIGAYVLRTVARIRRLGGHVQFYTPGRVVRDLVPVLADIECNFVVDHMGYLLESDGLTRADFDRLIAVVQRGRGWMKLSGPYRLAKDGNFEKLGRWRGPSSTRSAGERSGAATGRTSRTAGWTPASCSTCSPTRTS